MCRLYFLYPALDKVGQLDIRSYIIRKVLYHDNNNMQIHYTSPQYTSPVRKISIKAVLVNVRE